MKRDKIMQALAGHPNAAEILAVLDSPVEANEHPDRVKGYVVGYGDAWVDNGDTSDWGEPMHTTHRLRHWEGGFDPEGFLRHDQRCREARAQHGLQFLQRPNNMGPYIRRGPSTQRKIQEAYKAQVEAEKNGEEWKP